MSMNVSGFVPAPFGAYYECVDHSIVIIVRSALFRALGPYFFLFYSVLLKFVRDSLPFSAIFPYSTFSSSVSIVCGSGKRKLILISLFQPTDSESKSRDQNVRTSHRAHTQTHTHTHNHTAHTETFHYDYFLSGEKFAQQSIPVIRVMIMTRNSLIESI